MKNLANFFFEVGMLKRTPRTGFQFLGSGTESVAEHSFRTAIIGYTLARQDGTADVGRVLQLCLFHDIPEARTGDLNYVNKKYVKVDEEKAVLDLARTLPFGEDYRGAIAEFAARRASGFGGHDGLRRGKDQRHVHPDVLLAQCLRCLEPIHRERAFDDDFGMQPGQAPPFGDHCSGITGDDFSADGTVDEIYLNRADPSLLDAETLADAWDRANGNRPWVGLLGYESWHLGMMGRGAQSQGGDRDVAVLWEPGEEHLGEFFTNEDLYTLPDYLPGEGSLRGHLEDLDAGDGERNGEWFDNDLTDPTVVPGTPAFVAQPVGIRCRQPSGDRAVLDRAIRRRIVLRHAPLPGIQRGGGVQRQTFPRVLYLRLNVDRARAAGHRTNSGRHQLADDGI